jgi:excisionase family DNA binding protein
MKEPAMAHEQDVLHCGTSLAAKSLGLSVTTVHKLVEQKKLHAWYTAGGHRRISIESIDNYLKNRKIPPIYLSPINTQRKIVIIRDENNSAIMYAPSFGNRRINL